MTTNVSATTTKATLSNGDDNTTDVAYMERLVIFHLSLQEWTTGSHADEGATIAELAESILYCYDQHSAPHQQQDFNKNINEEESTTNRWRAAVRLEGLAAAFWSLPRTLTISDNNNDDDNNNKDSNDAQTYQFITLTHYNLLLTLLEKRSNILAVMQFQKDARITPAAMATLVQRHYAMFCLWGGGSIHRQLSSLSSIDSAELSECDVSCVYPGMKELFQLHRKKRKYTRRTETDNDIDEAETLLAVVKGYQEEMDTLRAKLPITSLRTRLSEHFDAFCHEWLALRQINPAAGRSVLHGTPVLPTASIRHSISLDATQQHQRRHGNNTVHWKGVLESFWKQQEYSSNAILGVSIFVNGCFHGTVPNTYAAKHSNLPSVHVETTCLIMHFLLSIRQQLPVDHEPAAAGFLRRTLGGFLPATNPEDGAKNPSTQEEGYYLRPPPLSMLSATVQEIPSCKINDDGSNKAQLVWTPWLTLNGGDNEETSIRVCLYYRWDCDFVIFLDPSKQEHFSESLVIFSTLVTQHVEASAAATTIAVETWDREGQDILWIDRPRQNSRLYSSSVSSSRRPPKRGQVAMQQDERQQLSSRLSLDTLLALDDAMHHARRNSSYEMCTLLRQNWLVCHARNGQELYVILDVKRYVTVQDVTVAMEEIKKHFVKDHDQPQ